MDQYSLALLDARRLDQARRGGETTRRREAAAMYWAYPAAPRGKKGIP
ncbi:hypothetical protein ACIHCQ_17690 [Streptomyces sp. NPDC052236]